MWFSDGLAFFWSEIDVKRGGALCEESFLSMVFEILSNMISGLSMLKQIRL